MKSIFVRGGVVASTVILLSSNTGRSQDMGRDELHDKVRVGGKLISKHASQQEAEAECDRRNSGRAERPFSAFILLEPVAQRMGEHQAPTTSRSRQ
jgi:hypothetical protein